MNAHAPLTQVTQDGRVGNWMHVSRGAKYYPLDPRPSEVFIEDIAHHLSLQCRFAGATAHPNGDPAFYSVAEHSVHVSLDVRNYLPADVTDYERNEYEIEALMHDAPETYLQDFIRPLKLIPEIGDYYCRLEHLNADNIARRYQLRLGFQDCKPVKQADEAVCTAEMEQIILHANKGYLYDSAAEAKVKILCWSPLEAKTNFLERFMLLMSKREKLGAKVA